MFKITLPDDRAEPDMAAVASAFGISIGDLENDKRIGSISRWFEVAEDDEDDKPHQIFASEKLGIRVDVNEYGAVQSISKYESAVAQTDGTNRSDAGGGEDKSALEREGLRRLDRHLDDTEIWVDALRIRPLMAGDFGLGDACINDPAAVTFPRVRRPAGAT